MAKGIIFPIRLTDKQARWIVAQAKGKAPTKWAREYLLQEAPEDVRNDKGDPLPKAPFTASLPVASTLPPESEDGE